MPFKNSDNTFKCYPSRFPTLNAYMVCFYANDLVKIRYVSAILLYLLKVVIYVFCLILKLSQNFFFYFCRLFNIFFDEFTDEFTNEFTGECECIDVL